MESEGIQLVALVCLVYLVFLIGLVERDQPDELDKLTHGSGRLGLADHEPALFMTVRREIAEPRRETSARSREGLMRTRAVRGGSEGRARWLKARRSSGSAIAAEAFMNNAG